MKGLFMGPFFNSLKNKCKSTNNYAIIQTKGVEYD